MISITDLIGYVAAIIGTLLMVPQVLRSIKTKSVNDISNVMLATYLTQCVLWGIYGVLIGALPIILCNIVAFCIGTIQVMLKMKYR